MAVTKATILALRDLDKTDGLITIELSSEGGNVTDGLSLYEVIRGCRNQVNTVGMGDVQSIAVIVYLAGHERTAQKNVSFMDHAASRELDGSYNAAQLMVEVKELKVMDNKCRKIMEERTKKNAAWWKRKSAAHDFTFGYQEALKYGVITKES
jgi:ATP-dependent Clp protease protease subunit